MRDLLHDDEPPFIPRTDAEDRVRSVMPGDSLDGHPLDRQPNPYTLMPHSKVLELLRSGELTGEERDQVMAALRLQQIAQRQ